PNFEAALQYLPFSSRRTLSFYLAKLYKWLSQNRQALELYEQTLEIDQQQGDIRAVAITQQAMADVLGQLGRPQEALTLYEQALRTLQDQGDIRAVAITQQAMADVLGQLGRPQEALTLYEQAL